MNSNCNKLYGEVRVPMRDGSVKYLLPARIAVWANGEPQDCKPWDYEAEIRFDRSCGNQSCVNPRHLQPQELVSLETSRNTVRQISQLTGDLLPLRALPH